MKQPSSETEDHLQLSYKSKRGNGIDLPELLRGKDVNSSVRETFFRLYDYFKDQLRDRDDGARERAERLKHALEKERQARRDCERDAIERGRIAVRERKEMQRHIQFVKRWTVGMSAASLMIVSGLEIERHTSRAPENVLVEQLQARIESFDGIIQSREKQVQHYLYSENDKYGALLKAVDALKSQVAEMQWYVNEDTREIMTELRKHLDRLELKAEEHK